MSLGWRGSKSTAQQYGGERIGFIKGSIVFTKKLNRCNFGVLLDSRMMSWYVSPSFDTKN